MNRIIRQVILGFCLILPSPGLAGQTEAFKRSLSLPALPDSSDAWQTEIKLTSHPVGWEEFCKKHPQSCQLQDMQKSIIPLNDANWALIINVNLHVNKTVFPLSDRAHWGVEESWDYPDDGFGDCEDYALEKRRLLHKAGLPLAALMITVVRDLNNDGHAVLTIRTDRGDFVLDNKRNRVLLWSATGYKYIKRQANQQPNRWVSLGAAASTIATAAQ